MSASSPPCANESLDTASGPHLLCESLSATGKHLAIFLRGPLETGAIGRAVRDEVQAVNSALPVFGARTLDETISASLAVRRFSMKLIATFAVTALFLAALGIYGVMSCMVSERVHEFGLRMALGAGPADVMSMVMRQAVRLVGVGAGLGLLGAVIVSRGMAGLLVGVRFTDPVSFGRPLCCSRSPRWLDATSGASRDFASIRWSHCTVSGRY